MHFVPSLEARHLVSFTGTSPATPMQAMDLTLTSPEGMSLICWLIPLTCTLPMPTISIYYVCMYVCMHVCIRVCIHVFLALYNLRSSLKPCVAWFVMGDYG